MYPNLGAKCGNSDWGEALYLDNEADDLNLLRWFLGLR